MGLFGPTRPLSKDELDWQIAGFAWLVQEDGGLDALRTRVLATPDGDYFADSTLTGHDRAEQLLDEVKAIAGMAHGWPSRLVPQDEARGWTQVNGAGTFIPAPEGGAAGTFSLHRDEDGAVIAEITYDPALLSDEGALVATLAHEVAHDRLHAAQHSYPGGEALHEHLTDLAAVYLGFGIFLANAARDYQAQQLEMGGHQWQTRRQGYLSERALVTALVIAERLAGRDLAAARPWLKSYLQKDLDIAIRWFAKRDVVAEVLACDLADYGVRPLVGDDGEPMSDVAE